jgi:hypothetical protein
VKRRTAILTAVVGVGVLGGAGIIAWTATRPAGPDETARAYLSALAAGDADAVTDLVAAAEVEPLIAEAFSAAASYPQDARVEEMTRSGRTAGVRATAEFDGDERDVFFGMTEVDGRWRVTSDFLGTVEVTTTVGDAVQVGDAVLPSGAGALLPAVYEFTAAPRGLVSGAVTAAVSNDEPAEVHLEASLAPDATVRAQEELDTYARACAAGGTVVPPTCGLRIPWPADLASASTFAFRIERVPALSISADVRSFAATGGIIVATVTGADRSGAPASFTYRDDAWALRGEVRISGDEIVLGVH